MDTMKADVTNQRVADDLGITHSAVSRIRSGDRRPSLAVMLTIHEKYSWPLDRQALAWSLSQYGVAFEAILAEHYDG